MEQKAKVTKIISDQKASLSIIRASACGSSCGSCGSKCSTGEVGIDAKITIDKPLEVGDIVEVRSSTKKVLFSTFIVYGIPLALLIIGIAGGSTVLKTYGIENYETLGFLIGVGGLVISFFLIRLIGNVINTDSEDFEIVSIIKKKS